MNQPVVGPGSMGVSGGNRQVAATNPALSANYSNVKTAGESIGMTPVELKPMARHGVKRKTPTDQERSYFATLREAGGGQREMIPEVVGEAIANGKHPYCVIHNMDAGLVNVKVYREAMAEANLLVWNGEMPEKWMMYNASKPYTPPETFKAQQVKEAAAAAPVASDEELGLFDEPGNTPAAPESPAPAATLQEDPKSAEQIVQLQKALKAARADAAAVTEAANQSPFMQSYATIIEVEGFGELEGTCDFYEIRDKVLVLGYDDAAKRHIPNPKPSGENSVAQFLMDIVDGDKRHVFELAAPFDSRFTFAAAGAAGVTFQQFMILRHETSSVTA